MDVLNKSILSLLLLRSCKYSSTPRSFVFILGKENALNEVRILASINHPNVIGYKEAFFEETTNSLCIVMENADGGDLL